MLDKEKIKKLFKEKKYLEVNFLFRDAYEKLIFDFAKNNGIYVDDDAEVEELLFLIPDKFPELEGCINMISLMLLSEESTILNNLDDLICNYNKVKTMLT